jgi:hypothetical protein
MRKFVRLSQVIAVICMLTVCESCNDGPYPQGSSDMLKTVSILIDTEFMTSFTTSVHGKGGDSELHGFVCRLEQYGSGTDAGLGSFNIYLTCRWNPDEGSHSCTEGFITDCDGNTLAIRCNDDNNGVVFTSDFPYDQTYICSEFEFMGGTGRFEGASGRGLIYCDVKGSSNSMRHHWVADLTLVTD